MTELHSLLGLAGMGSEALLPRPHLAVSRISRPRWLPVRLPEKNRKIGKMGAKWGKAGGEGKMGANWGRMGANGRECGNHRGGWWGIVMGVGKLRKLGELEN